MKEKVGMFFPWNFLAPIIMVVYLGPLNVVGGALNCGGIFKGETGGFEYHRKNSNAKVNANVDELSGPPVCVWMIELLPTDGAGISLMLEDLDENSMVNFYAEGEPTDPVNTPITRNSTQINSSVELSRRVLIITLKGQVGLGNSSTKFVVSWTPLDNKLNLNGPSYKIPIQAVEIISTSYFSGGGEKGRYNFKSSNSYQKSVWILDAGANSNDEGIDFEVNVQFNSSSSCLSKSKSESKLIGTNPEKSGMSLKSLCECSYFGLFEILLSSGQLRLAIEFCDSSDSSRLSGLSTQLVLFMYATEPNSSESAEIKWEWNGESTTPTPTTESPISPEPPISASLCPSSSTISPCACAVSPFGVRFECVGLEVNQMSIENGFREIRQANGIPEGRGIHFDDFLLQDTRMTELDMRPFYGSRIEYMSFKDNLELSKVVNSGYERSIHVFGLQVWNTRLNRQGFGDLFKYFTNDMTQLSTFLLDLNDHNDADQSEFLPGLSDLTNLSTLSFLDSNISGQLTSERWNFTRFTGIKEIYLWGNRINGIGENVFGFDLDHDELLIELIYNQLNESSFHPNSGISRTERKTTLDLTNNQLTTLPAPIFETFLDAHPQNFLKLRDNPLVCDERLSWIKSRALEFVYWVENANCANDPGHTVFDSSLIP